MTQSDRLRSWYRGPVHPAKGTPLELLMIQGSRFCNIDCQYCYLPFRADKTTFDLAHLDVLIPKLLDAGLLAPPTITILWHAGEPMVLKPDWYEAAFQRIEALLEGSGVRAVHNFQTNAMLVNDAWIDLFRRWGVRVGVSIDGPADLHDKVRVTRDGKGTHARGLEGLRKLTAAGLNPSAICVLSADSLGRADEIYDFFRAEGVPTVGFNVEEMEGPHTQTTMAGPAAIEAYREFLKRIIARGDGDDWPMLVRELMVPPLNVCEPRRGRALTSTEATALHILSVDAEGKLFTWSPELVDLRDAEGEDFSIGHVSTVDFRTLEADPKFKRLNGLVEAGVDACRRECRYFSLCGGGAPVNKLSENGGFDTAETQFCRLTRQVVADVLEDHIATVVGRRRAMRRPAPLVPQPEGPMSGVRAAPPPAAPVPPDPRRSGRMLAGVSLAGLAREPGRVLLSPLQPVHGDPAYHDGALVPTGAWREPDSREAAALRTRDLGAGPLGFIAVVRPPEDIVGALMQSVAGLEADAPWVDVDTRLRDAGLEERLMAMGDVYARGDQTDRKLLNVAVSPPGLPTSTVELDGLLLGLHVDSWYRMPIETRPTAPNRLCLNLGREPRYFLFWNLPITRMVSLLGTQPEAITTRTVTGAFFKRFPDYPVCRLRIDPGEAYIAPTELLAHDARTWERKTFDICATVLGRFTAEAAEAPQRMTA